MFIEETMSVEPSNGFAEVVLVKSEKMATFDNVGKNIFSLLVVLPFGPVDIPCIKSLLMLLT